VQDPEYNVYAVIIDVDKVIRDVLRRDSMNVMQITPAVKDVRVVRGRLLLSLFWYVGTRRLRRSRIARKSMGSSLDTTHERSRRGIGEISSHVRGSHKSNILLVLSRTDVVVCILV
jgi:hypothetical protein